MWTQMNGAGPGVQSWIDEDDSERIVQTENFLQRVRSHLRWVRDTEKLRRSAIRKAASLAIRNDTLRQFVEREALRHDNTWRTCSSSRFVDHIECLIDYAIWHPQEFMDACGTVWPETKYVC